VLTWPLVSSPARIHGHMRETLFLYFLEFRCFASHVQRHQGVDLKGPLVS
jgi:hypothetical protein